jgi:tight adherence protein B
MSAVTIQRQVGGSLAGLFDMVADTVRQRQQFRRKIKGLTAMGRMSAYVLIGLPFVVGTAIYAINRQYMEPLLYTSTGHKLILLIFVMMGIGSAVLKKIVSFKG